MLGEGLLKIEKTDAKINVSTGKKIENKVENAGTLTVDAEGLKNVVTNTGTLNLGDGTLAKDVSYAGMTAAGLVVVEGKVENQAKITQKALQI